MSLNVRRLAALAATLAVGGVALFAAAPAFGLTIPFVNYAVSGTLTPKKLGEPVTLPKHSTFNGTADFSALPPTPNWGAAVSGKLFIPPFEAKLKLGGLIPINVQVTFTEVGTSEGTIAEAPAADCPNPILPGSCATMSVTSKAIIGIAGAGLVGINVPTECQTAEPVEFNLSTHLTFEELSELGPHFAGTVTIPNISCGGVLGLVEGPLVTALMSGPENPYALYIGLDEPAIPSADTQAASSVSQVSALLPSRVHPNGEPLTDCRFEYGTTTSYGASVPCQPEASTIKRLFAGTFVFGQAANLTENTTYHYRVAATNSLGTGYGPDATFTTLPAASAPEYGQCVAQKKSVYSDASCKTVSAKKGVPDHNGAFEWVPGPAASCVVHKKGEYTDSACTTKSAKAKKGGFERAPGPGYTSTSGPVVLATPGLSSTVQCASSSATGEVTGLRAGTLRIVLSGCETAGKKCTSEGPNSTPSGTPGVIDSNLLNTQLLGSAAEVFTQLTSGEHAPYSAEFTCEGTRFRTTGPLAGVQDGNVGVSSATSTTTFGFQKGEQALYTESQSGASWVGPDPTTVTTTVTNTAASVTEIR